MKSRKSRWTTLPWWIVILLIGFVAYLIVDALLCIGLARFGSGPACSSLDGVMAVYRALMKWAKYRHDELQALSGVAISVFMFFLAIVAYRLWRHGVQLARMQAQDTDAALTLTRQAATEASRAVDGAHAAFVAGERPWVQVLGVDAAARLMPDEAGANPRLDVRVKNVGRSPALDVRLHVEMRLEGSLGAPVTEPDGGTVGVTLFPAQEAAVACSVMLPSMLRGEMRERLRTDPAAPAVRGESPRLYLAGAVFYGSPLDALRRRTEFCFALRPQPTSPPARRADPGPTSGPGPTPDAGRPPDAGRTQDSDQTPDPAPGSAASGGFSIEPFAIGPRAVT